ncbi:MAG: sigma-70 family RNA polymerase sigma factor [Deltaproteobacteria bacterium]|nr:sigma-70 family RNA polymerase sigma factor [Deltaproteobacteria bacterium]
MGVVNGEDEHRAARREAERAADEALAERLASGDQGAFAQLVRQSSPRVYSIALRMLRDEQDALDVVQQTFLNVWRAIGSFRGEASLSGWINRIATNNALMKLRTRRRKPEAPLDELWPGPERPEHPVRDWAPIADKLHEDAELGQQIRAAVDRLPESYRLVVLLADYEELSMREIAEILEISVPNVKTRLHRARLALRQALIDYVEGRS